MENATQPPVIVSGTAKGGSGKTTVAVNLSACFAERKKRVLLVDLDAQGDATELLGKFDEPLPLESTTVTIIEGRAAKPVEAFGVGLVGWHTKMISLANNLNQPEQLTGYMDGIAATIEAYKPDVVFIDIPPAQTIAGAGAMSVATHILSAMKPAQSSLKGCVSMRKLAASLSRVYRHDIAMLGVIPIGEARNNLVEKVLEAAEKEFGPLLTSRIAARSVVEEASWVHMPVRQYERLMKSTIPPYQRTEPKWNTIGKQFMQVTEEIAQRLNIALAPMEEEAPSGKVAVVATQAEQ